MTVAMEELRGDENPACALRKQRALPGRKVGKNIVRRALPVAALNLGGHAVSERLDPAQQLHHFLALKAWKSHLTRFSLSALVDRVD